VSNYPQHFLFSFGGTLLGGKEIWQNNIRFSTPPLSFSDTTFEAIQAFTRVEEQNILDGLMDDLVTYFGAGIGPQWIGYSSSVTLAWGKFNKIGASGRYANTQITTRADITPVSGSVPPGCNVPQVAQAISFKTNVARGLANAGRIFLPMPSSQALAGGNTAAGDRAMLAQNWAALLGQFNDQPGLDTTSIVASVVSGVDTLSRAGSKRPITSVKVGDVLDTQRSRRSAMTEFFSETGVPGQ
jgi:hypothetical protein